MPFPLAHPAAVLPLRRYCPKIFSFPALLLGSVAPDFGYFFGARNVDEFSHRLLGSIGFCLPVGLSLLAVFYWLRWPTLRILPQRYQRMFRPLCLRPPAPLFTNVLSLLIGSWTHLVWDSFTHQDGWVVGHVTFLHYPLTSLAGRTVRVCHLLWYLCSFVGIVLVFLSYRRWQRITAGSSARASGQADLGLASLVAFFLLPIELVHHLIVGPLGLVLAGGSTLLLLLVIARASGRDLPDSTLEQSPNVDRPHPIQRPQTPRA